MLNLPGPVGICMDGDPGLLNFGIPGMPGADLDVELPPHGLQQFLLFCAKDSDGKPKTRQTMPHQHAER